jgi:hypothetical protein
MKEADNGTHEEYLGAGFLLLLKKLSRSDFVSRLVRIFVGERDGVSERDPGVSGGSCVAPESMETTSLRFLRSDCETGQSRATSYI